MDIDSLLRAVRSVPEERRRLIESTDAEFDESLRDLYYMRDAYLQTARQIDTDQTFAERKREEIARLEAQILQARSRIEEIRDRLERGDELYAEALAKAQEYERRIQRATVERAATSEMRRLFTLARKLDNCDSGTSVR